jgi:hypothetical protein
MMSNGYAGKIHTMESGQQGHASVQDVAQHTWRHSRDSISLGRPHDKIDAAGE